MVASLVAGLGLALVLALGLTLTTTSDTTTTNIETQSCRGQPRSGFIIAGGTTTGWSTLRSAEVFNPVTGRSCPVGNLPQSRAQATMCNNMICGDGGSPDTSRTCDMFDGSSTFTRLSVTLVEKRREHLCWGLKSGEVILLGGQYSKRTTERVSAGGLSSSASFSLQHDIFRACGVDLGESFVVIGGGLPVKDTVTQYNETGFVKDWSSRLNQARRYHACSKFVDESGKTALLVTGGRTGRNSLSSTEIYSESTSRWSYVASLPSGRYGISAATLDNFVFVFGKIIISTLFNVHFILLI